MKYINELMENLEQKNIHINKGTEEQMKELCSTVGKKTLP